MMQNISFIFYGIAVLIPVLTFFSFRSKDYAISDKRFILNGVHHNAFEDSVNHLVMVKSME